MRFSRLGGLVLVSVGGVVLFSVWSAVVYVAYAGDSPFADLLAHCAAYSIVLFILVAPVWLLVRVWSYFSGTGRKGSGGPSIGATLRDGPSTSSGLSPSGIWSANTSSDDRTASSFLTAFSSHDSSSSSASSSYDGSSSSSLDSGSSVSFDSGPGSSYDSCSASSLESGSSASFDSSSCGSFDTSTPSSS
jgi:hypothetical protein